MKFLDLQSQYRLQKKEIDRAIREVVTSGHFIGGPAISGLEKALSAYCGAPHSIACSSGTDALLLPLMALGIGPGDEVITTPYSFIATAEVVALLRAKTVFVDVDPHTYNIDPVSVSKKINRKTRAVISVSLFGQTADMDSLLEICGERIPLIEDAAQSFGADHGGKKSGNLSLLAATSFFPAKPLGCYGDGGAVFTQNGEMATQIRMLLNHGQSRQYHHNRIGINGRLDALQAAILTVKLRYLDRELAARRQIADYYHRNIDSDRFTPQTLLPNRSSAYAQYCLTIRSPRKDIASLRKKVCGYLAEQGIPTAVYYPVAIHLQKPFLAMGYKRGDFPVSERLSESMFALPIHPYLKPAERRKVASAVNAAGEKFIAKKYQ